MLGLLLVGERLRLRQWTASEHRAAWLAWHADPEVGRWLGDEPVPPTDVTLAIERLEDGVVIGGVALLDVSEDRRAELVVAIGDAWARGRGYGREAIRLVVRHALSAMGMREVFLRVHADNRRAVRCYLACGFVKEGIMVRRSPDGRAARVVLMTCRRAG